MSGSLLVRSNLYAIKRKKMMVEREKLRQELEDDLDKVKLLTVIAFHEAQISTSLSRVKDWGERMEYLLLKGKYSSREEAPLPSLILLDLKHAEERR